MLCMLSRTSWRARKLLRRTNRFVTFIFPEPSLTARTQRVADPKGRAYCEQITAPVRPGPWRTWRVSRSAQVDAGAWRVNEFIIWNTCLAVNLLKTSRTKAESECIASCFLQLVEREMKMAGDGATPVNVSTAIHRVGLVVGVSGAGERVLRAHARLFERLAFLAHIHCSKFGPRQLANIFWGLGKCGKKVRDCNMTLHHKAQSLPQTVDDVIGELLKAARLNLPKLDPVHFSNIFLGLAFLDYKRCTNFKRASAPYMKALLNDFSAQQLSNMTWALSKVRFKDEIDLLEEIAIISGCKLQEFSPRELCGLMFGLSRMKLKTIAKFLDRCIPTIKSWLRDLAPMDIESILIVFSESRYHPGDALLKALTEQLSKQLLISQYGILSSSIVGLAELEFVAPTLVSFATKFLTADVPITDYKVQDVCNVLWALVILDCLEKQHAVSAAKKLKGLVEGVVGNSEMLRLHQCQAHIRMVKKQEWNLPTDFNLLGEELSIQCRTKWVECQESIWDLEMTRSFTSVLQGLGYSLSSVWVHEVPLKVALVHKKGCSGQGVVLELVAEFMCFVNGQQMMLGSYLWRERVLKGLGRKVVRVNYVHLQSLGSQMEKEKYMQGLFSMMH